MYTIFLGFHNLVRWAVLILGIVAAVRSLLGWFQGREWRVQDKKWGSYFGMAIDIQLLLGLVLYIFLSPITRTAFQNFGMVMKISEIRFFVVEHGLSMVLAIVFAHLGSILPRKAAASQKKFQLAAIFFTLAVLLIVAGMPWARPLLPRF